MATNLIKAEIRKREFNKETYPSAGDITNLNWSPPLLLHFLEGVETRIVCPMHCQSSKKGTILLLLFGLGVDLDQTFGRKWLLRYLSLRH